MARATAARRTGTTKKQPIEGSIVAIVTPFRDGRLDEAAFRDLIEWHIRSGTHCIVPCGTTGESATLSHEEHMRVVELAVETVRGRVPVIAGTGSNSTEETIMLTRHAKKAGADAALVITPYYNKPSQEGLVRHFEAVAEACRFPMILYNVPGRTGVNMLPATVARCARNRWIVGIKEATGNLHQVADVIRLCPKNFIVLSGDDFTAFPTMALGGRGVISVAANVMPRQMAALMNAALKGDMAKARRLHFQLFPLFEALFFETNPVPAKTALALMGRLPSGEVRLPLAPMSEANEGRLRDVLAEMKLV
ncbi:4-hydroxy-tetrahydrodipicolinate synthase [Dissulfurirhabdus thermomarina]|uniref:4-hydroxy-tetrahydrodipicolinate synthase n=1 Tax=Dissulfurirhabdus thermomarina TaxID=1765737 RepID=A0A6N9TW97_DISTH|nr:4-hydroxy-tetrahydrodipicolinate synthase [Dissulfurirhabdus thermomarina]NDY42756.1 4-hydroxy-tetrahydrodipicolinate synthase [Dissulfurirhabdus thermomarina]NMX22602.1 4-hydroxy-tetrahydrodipicolinate synthase [Dissulfurirhabdus thermomarina]